MPAILSTEKIFLPNFFFTEILSDKVCLTPSVELWNQRTDDQHATNTRQASSGMLTTPHFNTTTFGLKSIYSKCIKSWNTISFEINKINREKNINNPNITDIDLTKMSRNKMKETSLNHILSKYEWTSVIPYCFSYEEKVSPIKNPPLKYCAWRWTAAKLGLDRALF